MEYPESPELYTVRNGPAKVVYDENRIKVGIPERELDEILRLIDQEEGDLDSVRDAFDLCASNWSLSWSTSSDGAFTCEAAIFSAAEDEREIEVIIPKCRVRAFIESLMCIPDNKNDQSEPAETANIDPADVNKIACQIIEKILG